MDRGRRVLTIHGSVVGIGWFPVALASLLALETSSSVQDWYSHLAPSLQGMLGTIVLITAFPLLWPIYLAIGWYETQTAASVCPVVDWGDVRRIITVQAVLTIAAALGAAVLGLAYRGVSGGEYLTLAWVPLCAMALGHLWTRRRLRPPSRP